jgi:hypothetical protein
VLLEGARLMFADPLRAKPRVDAVGRLGRRLYRLIVFLLSRVWLEVTSGKMLGMEFILDKFPPRKRLPPPSAAAR